MGAKFRKQKEQNHTELSREQRFLTGASEDPTKFHFEPDLLTIVKRCKQYEVDVYECVYNTELLPKDQVDDQWREFYKGIREFSPKYYGSQLFDDKTKRYNVRLENVLNIHRHYHYDMVLSRIYAVEEYIRLQQEAKDFYIPSYLDLKIGTDCVLRELGSESYQQFRDFDLQTTSAEYGFRVTGYCLNRQSKIEEHVCEDFSFTRTREQVKQIFAMLFRCTVSNMQCPKGLIEQIINRIQMIHKFCLNKGKAQIKGASLFFVCSRDYYFQQSDNILAVSVYLIDYGHMELLQDGQHDNGFLKGLTSTIELLKELMNSPL